VRAWAARFAANGVSGTEYPARGSNGWIRWYADIDDRDAATVGSFEAPIAQRQHPQPARKRAAIHSSHAIKKGLHK
jgi:hypothetical protein